ncbi:MAG: hypothetical protein ACKVJK_18190, partial [Methylophagaceae bacterium]
NIGSISGYLSGIVDDSDYMTDKLEQAQFIIRNSFRDGTDHQIKMFNISFSFVNSPLLTRVSIAGNTDPEKMIDVMDAAEIILDCMDDNDKAYDIVEQVIQCRALS